MNELRPRRLLAGAAALSALLALAQPGGAATAIEPYAISLDPALVVTPLWSVGDEVPLTGGGGTYQMVGIPDGLGAHRDKREETTTLYMNHELGNAVLSAPFVGGTRQRGSIVSRLELDDEGNVLSGDLAYGAVYQENTLIGSPADELNATRGFGRFCSGALFGKEAGFDRPIFFTGEESDGAATFDGKGGQTVAVFDDEAHALPKLGHFSKENTIVRPKGGKETVIISLEDGPTTPDSQLYLYVGQKDRKAGTVLGRNGLDNGSLYVFVADVGLADEGDFTEGSLDGHWVEIPGAGGMTDTALEAAADAAGAFGFVRIEDGAFNPRHHDDFFFVTTGSSSGGENELGRLYHLELEGGNPAEKDAELTVVYNADTIVAGGGDIALSPDNMDVSKDAIVIQEDGTTESRAVMGARGRDGSIWWLPLHGHDDVDVAGATRIVELDPPGRDGTAVGPGVWESSGIIDAAEELGEGTWLFDVQAHGPTTAPKPGTVEDGQLLLLRR